MIDHACPKALFHLGARGLRREILSKKEYKGVVWPIHRLKKNQTFEKCFVHEFATVCTRRCRNGNSGKENIPEKPIQVDKKSESKIMDQADWRGDAYYLQSLHGKSPLLHWLDWLYVTFLIRLWSIVVKLQNKLSRHFNHLSFFD